MRLQRRVLLALLALAGVALLAAASRRAPAAGDPRIYDSPLVTPAPLSPLQARCACLSVAVRAARALRVCRALCVLHVCCVTGRCVCVCVC
jgi:hypothetical protein